MLDIIRVSNYVLYGVYISIYLHTEYIHASLLFTFYFSAPNSVRFEERDPANAANCKDYKKNAC